MKITRTSCLIGILSTFLIFGAKSKATNTNSVKSPKKSSSKKQTKTTDSQKTEPLTSDEKKKVEEAKEIFRRTKPESKQDQHMLDKMQSGFGD